jgi:hypothetical protein
MWTYERFMSILNGYMRNKAFPEGSMIESYYIKESIDCCIDYIKDKRAIGLPESRHEGRLSGKGPLEGKDSLTRTTNNWRKHMLVFYNNLQ